MEAAAAMHQREREFYEVTIENKMMMYRLCRKIVNTSEGPKDAKWIFVLSTTKILYIGSKSKGTFQHSSFLAGGATSAAGRLVIANGILKAVWPHSGHYRPTEANFREFMKYLRKRNVDLTDVKGTPSYAQFMYGDADSKFAPSVKGVAATAHTACYYVTF